ncbi:MAG: hypothetical protein PHC28_17620, partial [Flavobacterium sp.]|nr:hypothetical protein [Flavobacterium sp.]
MKIKILVFALCIVQSTMAQDSIQKKRSVHLSFIHPINNDGKESKHNSYSFSFNILTGKTGSIDGVEIGGLYNQNTQDVSGVQISGLINHTKNNVNAFQIAGISNISGITKGIQYAGISNITDNFKGMQTSGILNIAKDFSGIQISGLFNKVKNLNGLQLSLINVVDSIEKGGAIGIINIIKKGGYQEFEISASDYQNIGISYKSGGKHIYSIITAGYNFTPKELMIYGLGIGTIMDITPKWKFRPELVWSTYSDKSFKNQPNTNATHFKFGLMRKLSNKMAISF